jgi:hypothetical protein
LSGGAQLSFCTGEQQAAAIDCSLDYATMSLVIGRNELAADPADSIELTILMPCLNEAETISVCIDKAKSYLARSRIAGEVLVADNGSTDDSIALAIQCGARVISVAERGYGAALRAGLRAAHGRFVIMGDADDSYDFARLDPFVAKLKDGCDLVLGNRFAGGIAQGAMPFLHRYLGNPVLSLLGRLFFHAPVGDFHCGLRGVRRESILALDLQASGMEFASESVIKAALANLVIAEVPTTLAVDGRSRPPHLRTWQDGWRHLRLLLMFSPRWLFFYPGLAVMIAGAMGTALLFPGPVMLAGGIKLNEHTFLVAAIAILVGFQVICFGIIARIVSGAYGLLPDSPWVTRLLSAISLERGLAIALVILCVGLGCVGWSIWQWTLVDFGPLTDPKILRVLIFSMVLIATAVQIAFMAFLVGIISSRNLQEERERL